MPSIDGTRPAAGDHTLTLPDGRTIGYAVYGDPAGAVVVNCHGGLVSGHDMSPAHDAARILGLCVVSPDRPGVGRTDRLPDFSMVRWVHADLVPLLDHLGVDRFSVMGWSEGGQFALATAHEAAARVDRCAVIAGCPPLDDGATLKESNQLDRIFAELARWAPWALRLVARGTKVFVVRLPGAARRAAVHGMPAAEAQAVLELGPWFPQLLAEGAADPEGVVEEYRVIVAPWGFAPEDVTVPVRIYQGTADTLVPEKWGRSLAERIPGAELILYPGEGHFIALTRRREVLEWLAQRAYDVTP
jgi:pimeloyl-ACP methyl ester carboxylesterase